MSDNRNSSNKGNEANNGHRPRPSNQPQVRKNSNDERGQRQANLKNTNQNHRPSSEVKRSSSIKANSANPNNRVKRSEVRHKAPKPKRPRRKTYETQIDEVVVSVGEMDYFLLFVIIALILIGIIMVFSASSYQSAVKFGTPYTFFIKQSIFALLGLIGLTITANVHYNNYLKKWPFILYVSTTILLILVLIFGEEINGAKRWLTIPGTNFGFQPSEIAKVTMILTVSSIIARRPKILNSWKGIFQVGAVIMFMAILIGIENMSTAIIVMLIGFGIIFVVSPFTKQLLGIGFAGAASLVSLLAYQAFFAEGFRGERFKAWLDPFANELGKGFQTVQSLYAIASGGFFGLGLGNSRQKLSYIPESHNDIIFAIICEELGFFGAAVIIGLYIILIYRGVQIALKAPNLFGTLVAFGIVIMIAVQVIINVAVVTNTIPNTGIALPFISYGGTSLIFMITTMGILLNISRYTRK